MSARDADSWRAWMMSERTFPTGWMLSREAMHMSSLDGQATVPPAR
ncbi:hypothetical protein [Cystobacter fuscus]